MSSSALVGTRSKIGPNAITRVKEALDAAFGAAASAEAFRNAGLSALWVKPPTQMVDERDVQALFQALHRSLGAPTAEKITYAAGLRTADYLLAHRIPKTFQLLLRFLPAKIAALALLIAIRRHAWTFTGSGRFSFVTPQVFGPATLTLRVENNPLCVGLNVDHPVCTFHAAVFQRLFAVLVHSTCAVSEISCGAQGDIACVFEVCWPD